SHGLFGAHIIEPPGSTWHDPVTGNPIRSGSLADIRTAGSPGGGIAGSFREAFIALSDEGGGGDFLPPLPVNGMINLRASPLRERNAPSDRPELLLSSVTNGDPRTPVIRTYLGDPLV